MMRNIKAKLLEKDGSTYIDVIVIFLVIMMVLSVAFEFIRVQIVAHNVRDSFERAILTVVSENYNEVYSGFRENDYIGGMYEGGPAGGGDMDEIPEWLPINDYGNVKEELEELLHLKYDNTAYKSDKDKYELKDIYVEVWDMHLKYEVKGNITLKIPLYFSGLKVVEIELPLKVHSAYTPKY